MIIYNIAIWGLGGHAINRIIPVISSMNNLNLVGVCSRNNNIVNECAENWNCNGWTNHEEMLSSPDIDIIYIAMPIGVHYTFSEQALNAGKHVWCEKPLTCNYEQTKSLIFLAEKNKKVITESFMYLYHPQFERVKKFKDESKQLHSIICRFGIPKLNNPGFRNDPKLCGGAFWDVASYPASAIISLCQGQEVKVLFSEIFKQEDSPVDSGGRALLLISEGVSAYFEWGVGIAYKNEIDLWSENGSFYTDKIFSKPVDYVPSYHQKDLHGNEIIEYGEKSEQFLEMFNSFIEMFGNEQKVIAERKMILNRAKLMDDILNF